MSPTRLRTEMMLRGLDNAGLAEAAGIGEHSVGRALAGSPVSVRTFRGLAKALTEIPPLPGAELLIDTIPEAAR